MAQTLGISRPTLIKVEKGERELTSNEQELLNKFVDFQKESSQNSDDIRINIPQKNIDKFKQVLLYILQEVGSRSNVGMTVIYKLLYFIDFDYYEKYEKQLMGLTYIKNTYGPTPREFVSVIEEMKQKHELEEINSEFFKRQQKKFLPLVKPDLSILTGQELEMINNILNKYGDKNASELSDLTHRDMPWTATQDKSDIDYELAFYRTEEFSAKDYSDL